jgi:hypothetical protein
MRIMNPYLVETFVKTTGTQQDIILQNTDHWTGKWGNAILMPWKLQVPDFIHLSDDDAAKIIRLAEYLNKSNSNISSYAKHVEWARNNKIKRGEPSQNHETWWNSLWQPDRLACLEYARKKIVMRR